MKVICKHNNPDIGATGIPDFDHGLELEKEYLVMGTFLAEKQLWYLIDEGGKPSCYPFQLFQVIDTSISPNWHFKIIEDENDIYPFEKVAVWGYYELCFDQSHYERLVERNENDIRLYFKRKMEEESD